MRKRTIITLIIILAVIFLAYFVLSKSPPETPEEVVKCIGEKSELYVQLGCSECEKQENKFGENYKYLTVTDCFFEREKCSGIKKTPTWIIKGKVYEDVLSIEELKELTGC